jgi:hypothetical protein
MDAVVLADIVFGRTPIIPLVKSWLSMLTRLLDPLCTNIRGRPYS